MTRRIRRAAPPIAALVFANLVRITDSPDDRIFVVFGQGHIPILRQLVIDHRDYCVEDPLPYLEGL